MTAVLVATASWFNAAGLGRDDQQKSSPHTPVVEFVRKPYGGRVTAITADTITIAYPGGVKGTRLWQGPDGKTVKEQDIIAPPEPPKTFKFNAALAAGRFDRLRGPSSTYRPSDVKIGDWVGIDYSRVNKEDICDHICISKRPGGRVPPAPGQSTDDPFELQWHERCNALQDCEERGIPLPYAFRPLVERMAPMPRLVTRRAPAAKD